MGNRGRGALRVGRLRLPRLGAPHALALAGGVVAFFSLPPLGWWPLGPVGVAMWCVALGRPPAGEGGWREGRGRFAVGWLFGAGLLVPGLWWLIGFTGPGYPIAVVVLAAVYGAAGVVTPGGRGRMVALPAAVAGAEMVLNNWPFGGVPTAELSQGQAAAPLAHLARLGGSVTVTAGVVLVGVALAALWEATAGRRPHTLVAGAAAAAVVVGATAAGALAPDGGAAVGRLQVAVVQGGGPRGLRSVDRDPTVVFGAQVDATARVRLPVDLIVWPENVINLAGPLDGSAADAAMRGLARSEGATILAGVTAPVSGNRFVNEVFAWTPAGGRVGPFVKVHRVPFGEWIPFRFLLRHLADLSAVPRDEVGGHGPGYLATPAGPVAMTISWEVFFDERALSGVRAGGQVLLVPTNASSYTSAQVPSMEVAAARLRAIATGRDVAQAAPTGYSALIDDRGRLLARSALGARAVDQGVLARREGRTPFDRGGLWPPRALVMGGVAASWALAAISGSRSRRSSEAESRSSLGT
ncbi:MAG TPA: apolipoprotein N-acyltransferase [Acidimicrobiales bacterium]|nr:apolipoprotein N-acyltransferase [Acidimicrobiales bacterium]